MRSSCLASVRLYKAPRRQIAFIKIAEALFLPMWKQIMRASLVLIVSYAFFSRAAPGVIDNIVVFPVEYSVWDTPGGTGCENVASDTGSLLVGRCVDINLSSVKLTPHPPPCALTLLASIHMSDTDKENSGELCCNLLECFWMHWRAGRTAISQKRG